MPNWCDCDLYISGPKEELEKFLEAVKTEESLFDFNQLIPYPEHFRERDRSFEEWMKKPPEERTGLLPPDGYSEDCGYEWHILNWGTKWNANGARLVHESTWQSDGRAMLSVELNFATAWSPPRPVIERASERFPDLVIDLRYFEGGMEFNGIVVCVGGEVTRDEAGPYFGMRGG